MNSSENQTKKVEECADLKNIQYKTMINNRTVLPNTSNKNDTMSNLDMFLESELTTNLNEQNWNKLNKTKKLEKLLVYADVISKKDNYDEEEKKKLISFFRSCLDNKRLQKVKDVVYDAKTGTVKDIPTFVYTKSHRHFTLKNIDKHTSTLKNVLKPLIIKEIQILDENQKDTTK